MLRGKGACKQAEQADPEMDEVEMEIEIEPDGAEIAEPEKAGDGEERVDGSKDETEEPRAVQAFANASKKRDHAAEKMKHVVSRREGKIEHFVSKEAHDAHRDEDEAAQDDVSFR